MKNINIKSTYETFHPTDGKEMKMLWHGLSRKHFMKEVTLFYYFMSILHILDGL